MSRLFYSLRSEHLTYQVYTRSQWARKVQIQHLNVTPSWHHWYKIRKLGFWLLKPNKYKKQKKKKNSSLQSHLQKPPENPVRFTLQFACTIATRQNEHCNFNYPKECMKTWFRFLTFLNCFFDLLKVIYKIWISLWQSIRLKVQSKLENLNEICY